MIARSPSDSFTAIVTQFPDAFERALYKLGSKTSLEYYWTCTHAKYCQFCLRTYMTVLLDNLHIIVGQRGGEIQQICVLPFAEATNIVAECFSARVGLQFLRLESNTLDQERREAKKTSRQN